MALVFYQEFVSFFIIGQLGEVRMINVCYHGIEVCCRSAENI